MARPELSHLDRLSHSIWLRAALTRYLEEIRTGAATPRQPVPTTGKLWAWFEREVIGSIDPTDLLSAHAGQLVAGVANEGNDPRRAKRLVPYEQVHDHGRYQGCKIVRRKPSGRPSRDQQGERAEISYYEIPLDLVDAVEELLPGSTSWESAFLWTLVEPDLLPIETIRRHISQLLHKLMLCRPSVEERRRLLAGEDYESTHPVAAEAQAELYRASLLLLTKNVSAQSMSLLCALCAESFLAEDDLLLDLHRDAFVEAIKNFFVGPVLAEAKRAFCELIGRPILTGYWKEPDLPLPSDLSRPLVSLADWESQTGRSWVVLQDIE